MTGGEDYYLVLGVPQDADQVTIRRTYQRLARRLHPSLQPADAAAEKRFEAILHAYRILSDPERRRRYDLGKIPRSALRPPPIRRRPTIAPRSLAGQLEELVVELVQFGGPAARAPQGAPGVDIESQVSLDLAEALRGVTTSLSLQLELPCGECGGRGSAGGADCQGCGGRGVVVELDRIRVRIPPAVGDGSRMRVRGKGNPSADGSARGDLYLTLKLRPHPYFRRRGADIFAEVPLTLREAALGAEIEVPTIDGPVRVKIPPGTDSGQVFRLRERGMAQPGQGRGDHYYTVQIVVPQAPDEDTRRLLQRLEQPNPRRHLPQQAL